jgi:hypothetical protein
MSNSCGIFPDMPERNDHWPRHFTPISNQSLTPSPLPSQEWQVRGTSI